MEPNVKELNVNGTRHRVDVEGDALLLWVLREDLELTGTHYGCGEAQCGACTVLLDGKPIRSCITPVSDAVGHQITTIEGLTDKEGELHPVQEAFLEADALQCGYCTSGMVLTAVGLLKRTPRPTEEQILQAMHGNICRCGTYLRILAAVRHAATGSEKTGGKQV